VGLCPECTELQGSRLSQKIQSHLNFHPQPLYG
jgi:uncharacterized protein YlaI